MKNKFISLAVSTLCVGALVVGASSAQAITFGFSRITDNHNLVDPSNQFWVDVTDAGNGKVAFTFHNNVGIASSIDGIYFDDGLLEPPVITGHSDGTFIYQDPPLGLPSGSSASPGFVTTKEFTVGVKGTGGIDAADEWLTLTFGVGDYKTYDAVINALMNPTEQWGKDKNGKDVYLGAALRIGLHVQSIGIVGGSDSFVNTVPDGGSTLALLGFALLGIGSLRRRISRN